MSNNTINVLLAIAIVLIIGYFIDKKKKDDKKKDESVAEQPAAPPVNQSDNRDRLIIDTDAGLNSDPDDAQTWITVKPHVLIKWNLLGIVSTSIRGRDDTKFIRELLNLTDTPESLPVVRGASQPGKVDSVTEGAQFYIDQLTASPSKVEIHIWGPISTLAQALKKQPAIAKKISKVHWVANWNRKADKPSYDYIRSRHTNDFALYRDEEAFRGMMRSGDASKLKALHEHILASKIGNVWKKYRINEAGYVNQGWKNGDLTCYLFAINKSLRDSVFKSDSGRWLVADGKESELKMATNPVRDWMIKRIKTNISMY